MAFRITTNTSKVVSTSSPLTRDSGNGRLEPNGKAPRTRPNAKSTLCAQSSQQQCDIVMRNLESTGVGTGFNKAKRSDEARDARDFLAKLRDEGVIDRDSIGRFAGMEQGQKENLLTLNLPRFSSKMHERINARRAIAAYADRYGYEAALAFKDALLQPRHHWIKGRIVKKRPFKLLGTTYDPVGLELSNFEPENLKKNLKKMDACAVLGERLKSAARNHPTLENMAPHLSLDDLSALNDQKGLFSEKKKGRTQIGELLHVPKYGSDGVSGKKVRQKIRDVILLATAKEAAAAKAGGQPLDLDSLERLKARLLEAAQRGPEELAKRHNWEMAKRTFQPDTRAADPKLRRIGKNEAEVKNYENFFRNYVDHWSEANPGRFIGLSELKKESGEAIGVIAQYANDRKFKAHARKLAKNQLSNLKDFKHLAKAAYLKELQLRILRDANGNAIWLSDREFEAMSEEAFDVVSKQRGFKTAIV